MVSVSPSLIRNSDFPSILSLHTLWWRLWSNNLLLGKVSHPLWWLLKSPGTGTSLWKALKSAVKWQGGIWWNYWWPISGRSYVEMHVEVFQFTLSLTTQCAHWGLPVCLFSFICLSCVSFYICAITVEFTSVFHHVNRRVDSFVFNT